MLVSYKPLAILELRGFHPAKLWQIDKTRFNAGAGVCQRCCA